MILNEKLSQECTVKFVRIRLWFREKLVWKFVGENFCASLYIYNHCQYDDISSINSTLMLIEQNF